MKTDSSPRLQPSTLLFRDALEKPFAAQAKLLVRQGRGGAEHVVQVVDGQRCVVPIMVQDDRCSVASGDLDATGGANRRGEDEVADAVEPERFAARFARRRVEARK